MIRPVLLALLVAPLAPAGATTFDLGGARGSATGYAYRGGDLRLDVSAATYRVAPAALTATTQLTRGAIVTRDTGGLGIATPGETGGQTPQVDTDGTVKEVLVLTLSRAARLTAARFNYVDEDDTLRLYGRRADGGLDYLGFPGEFHDNSAQDRPMGGGATVTGHTGTGGINNAWVFDVSFARTPGAYTSFYFTGQNPSADGYRLQSASFAAVPEPASWGLMALGFGLTGMAARRRRRRRVAMAAA